MTKRLDEVLYIVHCVDTEGPLYESPEATSDRLRKTFGVHVEPIPERLELARRGEGIPPALAQAVRDFLSRISYKSSWTEIDEMLDEILSLEWRDKYKDDFGFGYTFSWFVLDHVGFILNPRRRSLGYHSIYEHYRSRLSRHANTKDRLYWHFHPVSYFREAHKTSNNIGYTSEHLQVLSRRVIDYLDFPVAYRPGSHVERPDINLFLEQWIPFDYGNQGMPEREEDRKQLDLADGRYGDWRQATSEWEVYHPDFYDYQKKGTMRRFIARCLNLDSRVRPITEAEIEKAFARAETGKPTILAITNHDEREMRNAIDWFMGTVRDIQNRKFPQVKIRHANAVEALRVVERLNKQSPANFYFEWRGDRLFIQVDKEIWGPQPYFCFKTKDGSYFYENLDRQLGGGWSFTFDEDSVAFDQLAAIGVATHDRVGNTTVALLASPKDRNDWKMRYLNEADWI